MKYGIARALTDEQLQGQVQALKDYGCDEIVQFVGSSLLTTQVEDVVAKVTQGDEVVTQCPDRLHRNLEKMASSIATFQQKVAALTFLDGTVADNNLAPMLKIEAERRKMAELCANE